MTHELSEGLGLLNNVGRILLLLLFDWSLFLELFLLDGHLFVDFFLELNLLLLWLNLLDV